MLDISHIEAALVGFALCLPRMLATLMLLPFFARSNSAAVLRTAISASLALPIMPSVIAEVQQHMPGPAAMLGLMAKETMIGLLLGFALAIPFWAVEAFGIVIDNQRGATSSNMTNTLSGNDASPLGILSHQAFVVMFLILGGLTASISLVYQSITVWPVMAPGPTLTPAAATYYLGLLDTLMRSAIVLAAPIMICMLLAELALSLVSLFAPQMQVYFLAMPVKSGIAIFILMIYVPTLLHYMEGSMVEPAALLATLRKLMP